MENLIDELHLSIQKTLDRNKQYWKHYKGDVYEIVDLVFDSETNNLVVVHSPVENGYDPVNFTNVNFSIPLSEWLEEVEPGIQRFTKVK